MADEVDLTLVDSEPKVNVYGVAYTKAAAVDVANAKWAHADKFRDTSPQYAVIQFLRRRIESESKAFGNEIDVTSRSTKVVYAATALEVGGYAVTVHVVNMEPTSRLCLEVETGSESPVLEQFNTTKRVFPE